MDQSYNRKYYAEHKNYILKQLAQPEFCPICKKHISHGYMTKHLHSQRHVRLKQMAFQDQAEQLEYGVKLALLSFLSSS